MFRLGIRVLLEMVEGRTKASAIEYKLEATGHTAEEAIEKLFTSVAATGEPPDDGELLLKWAMARTLPHQRYRFTTPGTRITISEVRFHE